MEMAFDRFKVHFSCRLPYINSTAFEDSNQYCTRGGCRRNRKVIDHLLNHPDVSDASFVGIPKDFNDRRSLCPVAYLVTRGRPSVPF
jgi:hypothetical protein